jgi:MoaA/NifB/PqqE/SkfB family radical SAM enzyme
MNAKKLKLTAQFISYMLFKKRYPFTLNLTIGYGCNSKCEYCNFWRLGHEKMPKEKILRIVDEAAPHCFYINLYGGEPMLRDDIGEIIEHIQQKPFLFLSITTNGTNAEEKIEDLKKVDRRVLSLDGPRRYHDSVRGEGSFDRAMKALDILRKNNIPVLVNATLCQGNLKHVEYLMDLCMRKKVRVSFNMYRKVNDSEMSPEIKEYRKAIRKMMKYPAEIFAYPKDVYYKRYLQWPDWGDHKCTSGRDFCSINPEGEMFPCAIQMEDYERRKAEGEKVRYGNNVFKKGFLKAFSDLDLSGCLKCWTCDRTGISLVMNNKLVLLKYVLFYFQRDQFTRKNLLFPDRPKTRRLQER